MATQAPAKRGTARKSSTPKAAAKRKAPAKRAPAKPAPRKPAARKAVTRKGAAKPAARKAGAKRPVAKPAARKAVAPKRPAKPAARKTGAKRGVAKSAARKAVPAKPAARKAAARKAVARKGAAKPAARKSGAKRTVARPAARKPAARKAVAPKRAAKPAPRKAVARKAVAPKAVPAKPAPRKAAARKAVAPKRAAKAPAAKAAPKPAIRKAPAVASVSAPDAVGFIGLGTMGLPQALNLAKAGRSVWVYDANPEAMAVAGRQAGVTVAESPRALARRCGIVLTCLPDDAAVNAVFRGEEGLLQGLRTGSLTCDLSTVSPAFTESLAAELRTAGVVHFTGPMLGSKPQAEAGQVFYILGGPAEHLPRITPVLAHCGRHHIHVGSASAANKIKLLHNALGSVNYAAVAEALALCAVSGVNLQTFYDVVRSGGGMAFGNYFERKVPTIIKGDYTPRFKLKLAHKDAQLAKGFFAGLGVPAPVHEHARALLEQALAAGHGEEDASAVTRIVERRIGRPIRQG